MKPFLALVLAAAASAAEIPAGTHLLLRVENSVTSRTAKAGDGVHLRTSTPLSAGNRIVVPIGSYAQGVVTHAKSSARGHVRGELEIQLVTLMLPNGQVFKILPKTSSIETGPAQQRWGGPLGSAVPGGGVLGLTLAGGIAGGHIGAGIGMAAGAAAILIPAIAARGRDVELRQGMAVDVAFESSAVLE